MENCKLVWSKFVIAKGERIIKRRDFGEVNLQTSLHAYLGSRRR